MIFKRGILLAGGLAAAAGVPVMLSGDGAGGDIAKWWKSTTGDKAATQTAAGPKLDNSGWTSGNGPIAPANSAPLNPQSSFLNPPATPEAAGPRIDGYPVYDPGEVFRFDVSPTWIVSRWARVTTIAMPPDMQGYRVPLVTGPTEADLAGSLTYYFNAKQQVQRITFIGTTGNPGPLVKLMSQRFKFGPAGSNMPGVDIYQIRWHNQPRSEMQLRMSDVVRADVPLRRFDVDLEINLPDVPPSRPLYGSVAGR
jgi:hypothetical protein